MHEDLFIDALADNPSALSLRAEKLILGLVDGKAVVACRDLAVKWMQDSSDSFASTMASQASSLSGQMKTEATAEAQRHERPRPSTSRGR